MRHLRYLLFLSIAIPGAFADTIVVPNANATTVGNDPNGITLPPSAIRQQLIIGSGQFNSVGAPMLIDGFYLRSAPGTGNVDFELNFQVTLSTTQAFPNTSSGHSLPSDTFNNNVGADATVVYNGVFDVDQTGCTTGPCPFNIFLPFSTNFWYDHNAGRLLIDLTISDPSGGTQTTSGALDEVSFSNSLTSVMATVDGSPGNATTGTVSLGGPILQLDFTPTPEPGSAWLLALGGPVAFWLRRRAVR